MLFGHALPGGGQGFQPLRQDFLTVAAEHEPQVFPGTGATPWEHLVVVRPGVVRQSTGQNTTGALGQRQCGDRLQQTALRVCRPALQTGRPTGGRAQSEGAKWQLVPTHAADTSSCQTGERGVRTSPPSCGVATG